MISRHDWKVIDEFIKENPELSNGEVGKLFSIPLSTISGRRSYLGLRKLELEHWTPTQTKWLKILYPFVGDYEIALMFNEAYPKKKGWTLKHIEKKRLYLGLKRTKDQLKVIRKRNYQFGSWVANINRLHDQRRAAPGTIRIWDHKEYIRTDKGNESLGRYLWQCKYGPIEKGMNIVRINQLKPTTIENLECISNSELAKRNSIHRYPIEIKQTIITLNKLNRIIDEKQNNRSKGSHVRPA